MSKYHAIPTEHRGIKYASKAEAKRAFELDILQRSGKLEWWLRQVPIDVGEPGVDKPYRVDFVVADTLGNVWAEDVKGMETASFRRHLRQWRKRGPFDLHVISGKHTKVVTREQ